VSRLKITETFVSIQGEADAVGWPTLFIRLTGCPLRCVYCDTQYSFHGGEWQQVDSLIETARTSGVRHVCVTGGEPLAQKASLELLAALCDEGFAVSLETSGALDVAAVDPRVSRVVDLKTPGSGEVHRNRLENLDVLTANDQLKFVLCSRADYEWARDLLRERRAPLSAQVLFSPVWEQVAPRELAEWILADRLPVRLQVQLHKVLWGNEAGR
jgi:7-carboxy-7-deazaguanine synthase